MLRSATTLAVELLKSGHDEQHVKLTLAENFPTAICSVAFVHALEYLGTYKDDDSNPCTVFNGVNNDLLIAIANGDVDPVALAKWTLASRGYDLDNNFIGSKAEAFYGFA